MIIVLCLGVVIVGLSLWILIPDYRDRYAWKSLPANDPNVIGLRSRRARNWIGVYGGLSIIALSAFDKSVRPLTCITSAISIMAGFYIALFQYKLL